MDNRPIGVFDSGMGGLTTVRRLAALMPNENIIYFGDTGRVPYGSRSHETVRRYAMQDMRFLCSFDLKAMVIACGTVSSIAMEQLKQQGSVPIFGVVEPTAAKAAAITKNRRIGIIATQATISTGAYEALLSDVDGVALYSKACPLFVPLVENGRIRVGDSVIETVAAEYLQSLKQADIDTLILGCTHYPLLTEVIGAYMGSGVQLVDAGAEAAEQVAVWLGTQILRAEDGRAGHCRWYVSDSVDSFHHLAPIFMGRALDGETVEQIAIEQY